MYFPCWYQFLFVLNVLLSVCIAYNSRKMYPDKCFPADQNNFWNKSGVSIKTYVISTNQIVLFYLFDLFWCFDDVYGDVSKHSANVLCVLFNMDKNNCGILCSFDRVSIQNVLFHVINVSRGLVFKITFHFCRYRIWS
jgi:hypothetical protein